MTDLAGLVKRLRNDASANGRGAKVRALELEAASALERLIELERRIAEAPVVAPEWQDHPFGNSPRFAAADMPDEYVGKRVRLLLEQDDG